MDATTESESATGSERVIDGRLRVHYDGYWIKAYPVPADTLIAKKQLIQSLTRRLFNHVEHGLNVPGARLEEVRRSYEAEIDPRKQRVKGGMLAGALFNRAADIFTKVVEMQALGVAIEPDNALMRQCGEHLQEALDLGKLVLHRSGEEGIDELWGEPFKAFAFPIEEFYKSRYLKIAMTMADIDRLRDVMIRAFAPLPAFTGFEQLITDYARAAQSKCETLRTDSDALEVWANFVACGERLLEFRPWLGSSAGPAVDQALQQGLRLIVQGKDLLSCIACARVPMPKSTREFMQRCAEYVPAELLEPRSPERELAAHGSFLSSH